MRYKGSFRVKVIMEALEAENKTAIARKYNVPTSTFFRWLREYKDELPQPVPDKPVVVEPAPKKLNFFQRLLSYFK